MEIKTSEKIYYVAFKLFLETGYEATSIRDICEEVDVKASTLYFHYKSKQDLFFYIYDGICIDYIKYLRGIEVLEQDISVGEKLLILLKQKLEYYASDISKRKFILRYHQFPPEEISKVIREKYRFFSMEENDVILDIIGQCHYSDVDDYLIHYKRFENHLVYEMIVSSIRFNDEVISNLWTIFWNNITLF